MGEAVSLAPEQLEIRRALYASSGVIIDSEHGRARVVEPFDRPVIALGAVSGCAVRIQLRLCIRTIRAQFPAAPCDLCRKSRGWAWCADHEFLADLERATACVTEHGRVCGWAYALGAYWSSEKYAWGYRAEGESDDAPSRYVRGVSDDAADYSAAVWGVFDGLP